MTGIILALLLLGFASGEPEYHRVKVHHDTVTITEDVMIDQEQNYVLITVGHVDEGPYDATVNLHDFKSGFSAFKNIAEGKCTVEPVSSTMAEVLQRVNDIDQGLPVSDLKKFVWDCSSQPVPYENLERLAGHRIAIFCKSYQSFLASRVDEGKKRQRKSRRSKRKASWCLICFGGC